MPFPQRTVHFIPEKPVQVKTDRTDGKAEERAEDRAAEDTGPAEPPQEGKDPQRHRGTEAS
jgi:hypothetical protein